MIALDILFLLRLVVMVGIAIEIHYLRMNIKSGFPSTVPFPEKTVDGNLDNTCKK